MNPKSVIGILIIGGMIFWALYEYGGRNNPFTTQNNSSVQARWVDGKVLYNPPIYLCHLVQVNMAGILKNAQDAGITTPWITVGTDKGAPEPTRDNPNITAIDGMSDRWIDLDPRNAYFFDQCLGPYADNIALCDAVKAQNLESYVIDNKRKDCRIFLSVRH